MAEPTGTLTVVAGPIGNLGDLSERAREALAGAGLWVVEDTRVSGRLRSVLGLETPMRTLHERTSERRVAQILDDLRGGTDVALLSDAGAPCVSDPGAELIDACHEAGVPVDSIPGPSAVTNALTLSGFFAQRYAFLGFLPRKGGAAKSVLEPFADSSMTLVAFESPHRIDASLAVMSEVLGDRRVALCREMTKLHQQVWRCRLPEIPDAADVPRKGEFTIVIEGKRKVRS